jgi:hypothetical protein
VLTTSQRRRNLLGGLRTAEKYFMGTASVQLATRRISEALRDLGVPYAIAGGIAVTVHGHVRVTNGVDVLLTSEGLRAFKERWMGRGWVERFPGSRGMRDVEKDVDVDVLLTGGYPGDGKPKPVRFPDPARVAVDMAGTDVIVLPVLIELKLASGMSAPDRLRDFDDVIQLVRANSLPKEFGALLNQWVQDKYSELWSYAQIRRGEP